MKNIEDTIFDDGLPVNTLAMLNRLRELLEANRTNCLDYCRKDKRIRRLMWLINQQFYGQLAVIEMDREWDEMNAEREAEAASERGS